MNKIAFLAAGVASADRARARIRKHGVSFSGHPIWSAKDLETLKRLHPDYREAMRVLGRSYSAVRHQTQKLGLTPKRDRWTGEQLLRLRKLYRSSAPPSAIQDAFPGRKLDNIYCMARYFGLRRPRKPFVPTGYLVIDQIRARCFELCLSMVDLDAMAKSGSFFAKAKWTTQGVNARYVSRAVRALDGQLAAVWNEADDETAHSTVPPPSLSRHVEN